MHLSNDDLTSKLREILTLGSREFRDCLAENYLLD